MFFCLFFYPEMSKKGCFNEDAGFRQTEVQHIEESVEFPWALIIFKQSAASQSLSLTDRSPCIDKWYKQLSEMQR